MPHVWHTWAKFAWIRLAASSLHPALKKNLLFLYNYDSNSIHAKPMKNKTTKEVQQPTNKPPKS
jgi:hypothetical protein